jgi:hypothetical protein
MAKPRNLKKTALTEEQTTIKRRLDDKIGAALSAGQTVPCILNPDPYDGIGSERELIEAAQRCGDCPAFTECAAWKVSGKLTGGLVAAGERV